MMKDIFLFYFFSSLLPQLSNSYSRKPKDKKTLALCMANIIQYAVFICNFTGISAKIVLVVAAVIAVVDFNRSKMWCPIKNLHS